MVNTVSETTSWMTFSCIKLKGPPRSMKPMRLAGIMKLYSNKATPHDAKIMSMSGQLVVIFISSNFRFPYQAKVMKILETTNIAIVKKALIFLFVKVSDMIQMAKIVKRGLSSKLFRTFAPRIISQRFFVLLN